jgi:hypothetical protein
MSHPRVDLLPLLFEGGMYRQMKTAITFFDTCMPIPLISPLLSIVSNEHASKLRVNTAWHGVTPKTSKAQNVKQVKNVKCPKRQIKCPKRQIIN